MSDIEIIRYSSTDNTTWDSIVEGSKNAPFFYKRNFIEYHGKRYIDHSLIFSMNKVPFAVMPANLSEDSRKITAHSGLTFGGIAINQNLKSTDFLKLFECLIGFLRSLKIDRFVYKAVPSYYAVIPAQEELYAIFKNGGKLIRRDMSSLVTKNQNVPYSKMRVRSLKKCNSRGLIIKKSLDYKAFWIILRDCLLTRHGASPTHSIDEIEFLALRFPQNIKLYVAEDGSGSLLAGIVVFESANVSHFQYIASTEEGRNIGALDSLINWLLKIEFSEKTNISFGISTELNGTFVNLGLLDYKESFGARAVIHDFYEFNFVK